MQYVYRYIGSDGNVLYIGITSDMRRRVNQHKEDKLKNLQFSSIQYFPVKSRTDAEIIETYLISTTKSCHDYNISKTAKEKGSFLNGVDFPWESYTGRINKDASPFVIPKTEKIYVKEKIYINAKDGKKLSDSQFYDMFQSRLIQLTDAITECSKDIEIECDITTDLCDGYIRTGKFHYLIGAYLHQKWLDSTVKAWKATKKYLNHFSIGSPDSNNPFSEQEYRDAVKKHNEIAAIVHSFEEQLKEKNNGGKKRGCYSD